MALGTSGLHRLHQVPLILAPGSLPLPLHRSCLTTWGPRLTPLTRFEKRVTNCQIAGTYMAQVRAFMLFMVLIYWQHASCTGSTGNTPFSFPIESFPQLAVERFSKPSGAGTAPIALPQDQGVALEDPQPASRVQDSATNEICSWQFDANGSFFGVFDPPPKVTCLIYFHTLSHCYSIISTAGVCLSYPQALRLVSWLDTSIWFNTSKN